MSSSPPVKDGVKGSHPGLGNLRTSNAKIEKEFNDPLKFIYFAMIYKPSTETKQMMQNCMLKLCGISFTFEL